MFVFNQRINQSTNQSIKHTRINSSIAQSSSHQVKRQSMKQLTTIKQYKQTNKVRQAQAFRPPPLGRRQRTWCACLIACLFVCCVGLFVMALSLW
jgi:hypothetical protein